MSKYDRLVELGMFTSSTNVTNSGYSGSSVNSLGPRQNGRHFADDIFRCILFNENVWIPIKISLNFVPRGSINNTTSLVQIMAWRRPGDKPLSESMMVSLLTHICVTRPQWVKTVSRYCKLSPYRARWINCKQVVFVRFQFMLIIFYPGLYLWKRHIKITTFQNVF